MAGVSGDGYSALGNVLAGGNMPAAAYAEAQGENLGANTEKAIAEANARIARNKALADPNLKTKLASLNGSNPALGDALSSLIQIKGDVGIDDLFKGVNTNQTTGLRTTIADPNSTNVARTDAAQAISAAGLANPNADAVGDHLRAQAADERAKATRAPFQNTLDAAHAGYYDRSPGAGMASMVDLTQFPELQKAVSDGRLDPSRLNSRTVGIMAQLAKGDPNFDFNAAHGQAVMQANPTFQTRSATLDTIPHNFDRLQQLSDSLDFSPVRFKGAAEAWAKGELNDPTMSEYMALRNDTLLKLAATMRGVGMSDQAHQAEIEAYAPTLTPQAFAGYVRGQMTAIEGQQHANHGLQHRDLHGGNAAPAPAPGAVVPPAAGGAPPGADGKALW